MSRVGRKPIPVPQGVKVTIGETLQVEGPKGKLSVPIPEGITIEQDNGQLQLVRATEKHAALHGLARALASNAVIGVSTGWTKELDIVGIGYRGEVKGNVAVFSLGYSHPIELMIPEKLTVTIDKQNHIVVSGHDKQQVGQLAAVVRGLRPPEPYKNKGIRYTGEKLRKKVGKAGAGGAK
jgi:large subunit ribosomal protein L6